MIKKLTMVLLCVLLVLSGSTEVIHAAQPTHEIVHVGNEYVDVRVSKDNGRYSIENKQGHPLRLDNEAYLLFFDEHPDTSFTTFRIDGKDYIFGENYGFMGLDSGFTVRPTTQGLTNQSVWHVNGMEVTQTITLVDDINHPNIGNVKIAYEVTNTTNQTASIGSRILLDTMLGAEDASPIALSGSSQYVRTEKDLQGASVPPYWRAVDDPITPKVMTYGFLGGWENRLPDRMIIAHWEGISTTTWDYQVQDIDLTHDRNPYGSRDSAVALFWNPRSVGAGQTIQFETYYGLGSFFTAQQEARYGVQLYAPRELEANSERDHYTLETFEIHLTIDNTRDNALWIDRAIVELGLPLSLELAEGESRSKVIEEISRGEVATLSWRVKAIPQQMYTAARYWVSIRANSTTTTHADYVIMPALSGVPPQLQLWDILPQKKFVDDSDRELRLKGQGFSALVNNWDAEIVLTRERDGVTVPIQDYAVLGDNQMEVVLNELWADDDPEPGSYTLQLDAGEYGKFTQTFEMTVDTQYQSKKYGLLAIVKQGWNYVMVPADNEQDLSNVSGEVLLKLRGDIRELRSGSNKVYEAAPGTTINSVIRFDSNDTVISQFGGDELLHIGKDGGVLTISGSGVLSIPQFPFVAGPFSIELKDGTSYALEAEGNDSPIEINWELADYLNKLTTMQFFPVTIKQAVIGSSSVSFGGSLSLNFGALGEDSDDIPLKLNVDLDEARFGLKNSYRDFGFIGLRAEGEVGIPRDFVPGMKFGAEASVLIDTLDRIYQLEADVNFKVIETGGLFTLRFTESKIPILDNFEFYVGSKPGIPLIPGYTVGYITKGGGGFNNLYDTLTGNFNILPPLKLIVIGGMSIANILFADDMRLEASLRGIHFESAIAVMDIRVFERAFGRYHIEDSLTKAGIEAQIGAEVALFDVIEGDVSATISYDSNKAGIMGPVTMSGGGNVSIIVPRGILFLGGRRIGNVYGYVSTDGVSASGRIIGVPINVRYNWGDRSPRLVALDYVPAPAMGLSQQQIMENGKIAGTMTYGSNIKEVSSFEKGENSNRAQAASRGSVMVLSKDMQSTYDITVGDQDYALLELAYSGDLPEIEITAPNGQSYPLIEDENYLIQEISADESQSGVLEQYMYVSVVAPEPGTWTIATSKPLEGGRLMDVAELPELEQLEVEMIGSHELAVQWQSAHVDEDMHVALYLSEDGDSDSGRLLLSELDATGSTTVQLPDTLPSGEYYIRAALVNGDMLEHVRYSDTSFAINNAYELPAPEHVEMTNLGNGLVKAKWELDQTADGFVLEMKDENGEALPNMGMVEADGDLREANIGGTYVDQQTGELFGLVAGNTYRVEVTGYKEIDGIRVYGQPALSNELYVPEPNPANIELTVQVDDQAAKQVAGDHDEMIYIVNQPQVDLVLQSDQQVNSNVIVNDSAAFERSEDQWQQSIELEEGMNNISVYAVNEDGDITVSGVQVRLDTEKPDLKINAPEPAYWSEDTSVTVQGVAELGSIVTINGEEVETDSEGRFASEISLEGYLKRPITIAAADQAGNVSLHSAQAINGTVNTIEEVEIRIVSTDSEAASTSEDVELELLVGGKAVLELVGLDEQGNAYVLEQAYADWNVLLGSQYGELSGGVLDAKYEGDIVIHASYTIAEGYALQDSLTVRVHHEETVELPSYDDWYDEDWEDNYPERPASTHRGNGANNDKVIDEMLQQALKSIIEAEQGTVFFDHIALQSGQDQILKDEDRAELKVFGQPWELERVGIGMGRVIDPSRFIFNDRRTLIGDIYELKTNVPVTFETPPELLIRFGLEDAADPSKLGIYWYNETKRRWEYIGSEVNPLYGTVTARLPHFSKYALLYDEQMRQFSDMEGRWSTDAVYRLSSIDVINGWEKAGAWIFAPEQSITRQEFAKVLVAANDVSLTADASSLSSFADRSEVSEWAVPYMRQAVQEGWILGSKKSDAMYLNPRQAITRAEAAVMLTRMMGDSSAATDEPLAAFKDAQDVPVWARSAIAMLVSEGILSGYPDGTIRPMDTIKREEAAVMLLRFMDRMH